ncbi:Predicted permease YjgP/YjgQ family [hydrothermal vent metagenome]|uniref:Predicted permease YjgP/YjgQ family n=1 Tax=hydrothermal vent metagenome TaxID=652676 RepID=A0A1W1EBY9_9ZZZZ
MVNVRSYMSTNYAKAFLTIFLPFFLIISLVYLVKISALTAQIQVTFAELLLMYFYSVPDIIFYTLPISFVAALANILIRLSTDSELIALYALGLKSKKVLRSFLILGFLFSLLLLTISFFGMPLSKQFYSSFKETKKNEAKLNILAGKLGQKFGEYYIYVKEKDEASKDFINIVIYNRTKNKDEQFFAAKRGKLNKKGETTSLELIDGYGYTYSEKNLQQAKYKTFEVYDKAKKNNFNFRTVFQFWKQAKTDEGTKHKLLFYIFVSLIPFISVYLVAAFTMINPRYQSNNTYVVIFATVLLFYSLASTLQKVGTFPMLIAAILFTLILGRWLFHVKVSRYF